MATKSINLNPLFIAWSVVFVALAFITGSTGFIWVAAIPWLLTVAFMVAVMSFIFIMYMLGVPFTLTTSRKGSRVVRRGRR